MIKPMLAHKVGKKEVDWSAKNFIQPKLDGVRCILLKMARTLAPVNNLKM